MKSIWQACFISGLMLSGAAQAQLDTLIGGAVPQSSFSTRYSLNAATPANLSYVLDPAGSGRTVLLTRVKSAEGELDAIKRTDFYPLNETRVSGLRWYGISVYVPASWAVHPNPTVVAQIDTSGAPSPLGAPLALSVRGANLELNLNSNYRDASTATLANSTNEVIKLGPLVTSKWYCLVMRSDWSQSLGRGAITFWMNGEKVYSAANSTNSYIGAAHVPRAGMMFPGLMGVAERSMYTDFIRLGGPTTTVLQMYQISPCSTFVNGSNIQW